MRCNKLTFEFFFRKSDLDLVEKKEFKNPKSKYKNLFSKNNFLQKLDFLL